MLYNFAFFQEFYTPFCTFSLSKTPGFCHPVKSELHNCWNETYQFLPTFGGENVGLILCQSPFMAIHSLEETEDSLRRTLSLWPWLLSGVNSGSLEMAKSQLNALGSSISTAFMDSHQLEKGRPHSDSSLHHRLR